MIDNLSLWHAVEKTPVEHTKPITGKSYQGTSPKPHYIIQKATETFGPCGLGWGFTVEERIEDGAMIEPGFFEKMHVAKVRVWYEWNNRRGEVEHIGGTVFSGRRAEYNGKPGKIFTDEDAPKKSVTDALIKALSMIGFAGDIFMGRYDDSKYVSDLKQEAAEAKKEAADLKKEVAKPKALPESVAAADNSDAALARLFDEGNAAAHFGMTALEAFWKRMDPAQKRSLGGAEQLARWKTAAKRHDDGDPEFAASTPFDQMAAE